MGIKRPRYSPLTDAVGTPPQLFCDLKFLHLRNNRNHPSCPITCARVTDIDLIYNMVDSWAAEFSYSRRISSM